ncbi:hypothetical protein GIS00_23270 [Nakamurella sp. YIM 132087]|uniref:PucR C-terminal helix-turn-helix domain-containing protein n=1 Tax=Nakamurella alba TaxID=2665158 RepID=A0A7K1FU29_9ACTN|nr:helix-turn-helix domain-containing protein [Nakamurella alba]MTD16859.1 hypothetical protein [Nakamurella alba]
MQGLLRRISSIDSAAERALRIIEFFDQLVVHGADIEAITRATAVLAEATVGAEDDVHGRHAAIAPTGADAEVPDNGLLCHDVQVGDRTVGRVWLHRAVPADSKDWDELIVERMSMAVAAAHSRRRTVARPPVSGMADPAIVQYLLGGEASEPDAARAALLLGFAVGQRIRAVAVEGGEVAGALAETRSALGSSTGHTVLAALTGTTAALLLAHAPADPPPLPAGIRACVGPAAPVEHAARSWAIARRGVRFAGLSLGWPNWLDAADLGCLIALDGRDEDGIAALGDVRAIGAIAARRNGAEDLALLDVVCASSSVREAATLATMHHSSVSYRMRAMSEILGFDLGSATARYRARTALLLWRLHVAR